MGSAIRVATSPVLAVEMDPNAATTYAANFVPRGAPVEEHVIADRIENVETSPHVDVLTGGPPLSRLLAAR